LVERGEATLLSEQEKNKALARRLLEALVNRDLDTIDEVLAPNFTDRSLLPGQGSSREEYKRSVTEFNAAFSCSDVTIEYQIAEGDMVVTKFSTRCIHRPNPAAGDCTGSEPVATYLPQTG
jgi:ketosteroid isomerase-like protein